MEKHKQEHNTIQSALYELVSLLDGLYQYHGQSKLLTNEEKHSILLKAVLWLVLIGDNWFCHMNHSIIEYMLN